MISSFLLWQADETYFNYRIPGMILTSKGTLLVYCEARREESDWAKMDILLQRSQDQGKSFSAPISLACGTDAHKTVNNPVMVQDQNGRIHFLYCEDYGINQGRILHRYSDDDACTWSEPDDITYATLPTYRNVFAIGPGHGICTKDGTLVFPVWMVPKSYQALPQSHKPSVISTLYSKDCGKTWQCGEILGTTPQNISPNETTLAPLEDGSVYLNCRLQITGYRGRAYSPNGYSDWRDYEPDYELIDPACFGSAVAIHPPHQPYTLLFGNCESKTHRKNVTVKASVDGGKSWSKKLVIDTERGGYVELAADSDTGLVYVLYEEDFGTKVHLSVFPIEQLTERI